MTRAAVLVLILAMTAILFANTTPAVAQQQSPYPQPATYVASAGDQAVVTPVRWGGRGYAYGGAYGGRGWYGGYYPRYQTYYPPVYAYPRAYYRTYYAPPYYPYGYSYGYPQVYPYGAYYYSGPRVSIGVGF